MSSNTILRITSAVVALALIAFAAWFWMIGGETQSAGLITSGLGLIALALRSPLERLRMEVHGATEKGKLEKDDIEEHRC